ncbi:MAG: sel1 repeat family protein [Spirochaetaceae bacterium]|nr:sel1 repeat family protein [Spirochaetaceae bacterium]
MELDEKKKEMVEMTYQMGHTYFLDKDYENAVVWFERAANMGHILAYADLSTCYSQGWGVEKNYDKAFQFCKVAAEGGCASAQSNLGVLYINGWGTYKSDVQAIYWWEKAAEQGDSSALNNLGIYYCKQSNYMLGGEYLEKAIKKGNYQFLSQFKDLCNRGLYDGYINL